MKNLKSQGVFFSLFIVFLGGTWMTVSLASRNNDLLLQVKTDKSSYTLGEAVNFEIEFQNTGTKDVAVWKNADEAGVIEILIAKNDNDYRKYVFGGIVNGRLILLKPNDSISFQKTGLWNGKPDYSHLNADAARSLDRADRRVLTNFLFQEPGTYYIKVHSSYKQADDIKDYTKHSIEIESEPIKITITEPVEEDLEVWNKIKDDDDIGYFLQEGDFKVPIYMTKERENLRQKVEQLLINYPNSFYAKPFKQNLEKFQADGEKRKAFAEKIKANQPN